MPPITAVGMGGQNQQESKHTVVAAEYLPVLLSLLMLTGKVFL